MQTLKQEYRQFLNDNFKGLRLRKPLFYNWRIGLRFDLQIGNIDNSTRVVVDNDGNEITHKGGYIDTERYFDELINRSTTLFRSVFASSDKLLLVFIDYKHRRRKIRTSNFVFKQIKGLEKSEIAYTKEHQLYEPSDKLDIRNVALFKCSVDKINYKEILAAVANTDFPPRQPRLDNHGFFCSKEIYFINLDKGLIFHMYDDRGLDIIATDKETLRPIYLTHNNWVLDYDRKQIDNVFGEKNAL